MEQRTPLSPVRCTTLIVDTGRLCGRPTCEGAPSPICREHAQAVYLYVESRLRPERIEEDQATDLEALYAKHAEMRERYAETHPPVNRANEVVYYIRFGDRVKIGYTTNMYSRMMAIPHDEVLATEPGTMQDERARHAAFADLRVTGEWFRYEEPLVSHIAGLQ